MKKKEMKTEKNKRIATQRNVLKTNNGIHTPQVNILIDDRNDLANDGNDSAYDITRRTKK